MSTESGELPPNTMAIVRQEFIQALCNPPGRRRSTGGPASPQGGKMWPGLMWQQSRSAWLMVLPQQKASLRAIEHQPRQRMQESPSPAASPEPDPLLRLPKVPKCSEPGSAPPPPGYSQENLPAPSGSFSLSPSSSLPRRRRCPAACRGGAGGCSGRVPAGRLPRRVQRSSPGAEV